MQRIVALDAVAFLPPPSAGAGFAANDNPYDGGDRVGGYAPLAVASGPMASSVIQWLHGNHLGTPVLTTDPSGTAVTPSAYAALGYPGQTRTFADLYYNRYRDYDTTTGRYIQADPIGLDGDANPYAYARGNPLRWSDPMGQSTTDDLIDAFGRYLWKRFFPPPPSQCKIAADPCKGLRRQLADHQRKLREYISNPLNSDNNGFLFGAVARGDAPLYMELYRSRIFKLEGQIKNFKKLLEDCERANGF